MDRWDVMIVLVAGYVAVTSLVRLMAQRRNLLVGQVREQLKNKRRKPKPKENEKSDRGAA